MGYHVTQKMLFRHCDPAGIVFFPRYFEMVNDCLEAFFADALDWPWERLHGNGAVPTVQINTRFSAPSRQGEVLTLHLRLRAVGRTSLSYTLTADCHGEIRFETRATLVNVGPDGRPVPWPDAIRDKLTQRTEPNP
ncbi:acyl-CoA thioesterase [Roseovarius autotrophicus]|uniref:acyl-CoA thioesterase n=1 Tax=Roseovarius autotrophicus TaxID=2824121 RepID=UPI001B37217D|nr:thioesterase family protein [Roseovarius autotrophicus]